MNKSVLFISAILSMTLILGSCSSDEMPDLTAATPSSVSVLSPQLRSIKKYLKNTHRGTRADNYILMPYVVDGDTVMYIAQYENGWELFSNSLTAPMSLMKSYTGTFYETTNTDNQAFKDVLNIIIQTLRQNMKAENTDTMPGAQQWALYSDDNLPEEPDSNDDYIYKWVGSEYVPPKRTYIPHLLATKWNQNEPFNYYIPFRKDIPTMHEDVGCTAVALGQFLYYAHYKWATPTLAPSKATYNNTSNKYTFSEPSLGQWAKMNKNIYEPYDPATSIYLGYMAQALCSEPSYNKNGTYTGTFAVTTKMVSVLRYEYPESTGIISNGMKDYNKSYTIDMLLNKKPLVATLKSNDVNFVHVVVIDGIDYTENKVINYYAYVPRPESPDTGDSPDEDEEAVTYEELVKKYGQIEIESSVYISTHFTFNWGWGGLNDDVLINGDLQDIPNPGSPDFPYRFKKILDYSVNIF